jgi:hypothetical protein
MSFLAIKCIHKPAPDLAPDSILGLENRKKSATATPNPLRQIVLTYWLDGNAGNSIEGSGELETV